MKHTVTSLCHPDDTKACSACCGLFNHHDISEKHLSSFLKDGYFRSENAWRYKHNGSYIEQTSAVRDFSTHICMFQGFISETIPGCLKHPLYCGQEERDDALFGSRVCENYRCPAYIMLSDVHKAVIAQSIKGWYLYSIAIIDPLSTMWIIDRLSGDPSSKQFILKLNRALTIHARHLYEYDGTVFCYSMDEYNMNCDNFSLTSRNKYMEAERKEVMHILNEAYQ